MLGFFFEFSHYLLNVLRIRYILIPSALKEQDLSMAADLILER
jgi:hypothetical protein